MHIDRGPEGGCNELLNYLSYYTAVVVPKVGGYIGGERYLSAESRSNTDDIPITCMYACTFASSRFFRDVSFTCRVPDGDPTTFRRVVFYIHYKYLHFEPTPTIPSPNRSPSQSGTRASHRRLQRETHSSTGRIYLSVLNTSAAQQGLLLPIK